MDDFDSLSNATFTIEIFCLIKIAPLCIILYLSFECHIAVLKVYIVEK